jgi:hypothetical protein
MLGLEALAVLYSGLLAILIGALASAEERQYGTLDSQRLLPLAAWRQWTVKVGVTISLAVMLGAALPFALQRFSPASEHARLASLWWIQSLALTLCLASIGLYVSTLCASGVRALVVSFPVVVGFAVYVQFVAWLIWLTAVRGFGRRFLGEPGWNWLPPLLAWCVVVWGCALQNHRSSDTSPRRIVGQVAVILAWTAILLGILTRL